MPKTKQPPKTPKRQNGAAQRRPPGSEAASAVSDSRAKPGPSPAASNGTAPASTGPGSGTVASPDPGSNGAVPTSSLDATKIIHDQRIAEQAAKLRKSLFPVLTAAALGYKEAFEPAAYEKFLERVVEDCGSPSDPIERMLIEQITLAHYRIGVLHYRSADAETIDAGKIFSSAASRLLGEFRRLALALNTYRGKTPKTETDGELKVAKVG